MIWNGADARTVLLDPEGRVTLRAEGYQPSGLVKTPRIEGPGADLQTMPFAIVVGPAHPRHKERKALWLAAPLWRYR